MVEDYAQKQRDKQDELTITAYLMAGFNRYNHSGDPMPRLEDILRKEEQKEQSIDDMISILRTITEGSKGIVEVKE